MGPWNMSRLEAQLALDEIIYGASYLYTVERKSWNPMRFVYGKYKLVRINPELLFRNLPNGRKQRERD